MSLAKLISEQVTLFDYLKHTGYISLNESQLPTNISCPTHKDNKPSMRLYAPKNRDGYCFSCGDSYTSFQMHQALTGDNYSESVKYFIDNFDISDVLDKQSDKEIRTGTNQKIIKFVKKVMPEIRKLEYDERVLRFRELEIKIYEASMKHQ